MRSEPEISVIIPTYNREVLLQQTLRSLARQQLAPHRFEVLVCDDGSDDGRASRPITRTAARRATGRARSGTSANGDSVRNTLTIRLR